MIKKGPKAYKARGGTSENHQLAWDIASEECAAYAKDQTILLTSKAGPRPGSIWVRMEEPMLNQNKVKSPKKSFKPGLYLAIYLGLFLPRTLIALADAEDKAIDVMEFLW